MEVFVGVFFLANQESHEHALQIGAPGVKSVVYDLLAMTVIYTEPEVCKFMLSHPMCRWNYEESKHPFLAWLDKAYHRAGVTCSERVAWHNEIQSNFVSLNFSGLPIDQRKHSYDSVFIDTRSLIVVTSNLAQAV